jgi:hypothetical protein
LEHDSRSFEQIPVIVVSRFPDGGAVAVGRRSREREGVYEFALSEMSLPNDEPLSCVFCRVTDAPAGEFVYLGESAPFERTANGFQRYYHGSEKASVVIDSEYDAPAVSPPRHVRVARESRSGYYRLTYEAEPFWDWGEVSRYVARPQLDVGKTAYARSRSGALRNPAMLFEQAKQSATVASVKNSLTDAVPASQDVPSVTKQFLVACRFVQGLPYVTDIEGSKFPDYPKKPEEMLVEGFGDCEDKAILLGGLLSRPPFDMNPCLVFPPGHATIAIPHAQFPLRYTPEDALFEHHGTEYVYIEAVRPVRFGDNIYTDDPVTKDSFVAIYDGAWSHFSPEKYTQLYNGNLDSYLPTGG